MFKNKYFKKSVRKARKKDRFLQRYQTARGGIRL